jgi:hypothetical protein
LRGFTVGTDYVEHQHMWGGHCALWRCIAVHSSRQCGSWPCQVDRDVVLHLHSSKIRPYPDVDAGQVTMDESNALESLIPYSAFRRHIAWKEIGGDSPVLAELARRETRSPAIKKTRERMFKIVTRSLTEHAVGSIPRETTSVFVTFRDGESYLEKLRELPRLRSVRISCSNLNDRALKALSRCDRLEQIHIDRCQLAVEGLSYFSEHKLTWLDIRASLDDNSIADVLPMLQRLTGLRLRHNRVSTLGSMFPLANPRLAYLDVAGTDVGDGVLEDLNAARSIETLSLAHTDIGDDMLEKLRVLSPLRILDVGGCDVGKEGVEHIVKTGNSTIVECVGSQLTVQDAMALVKDYPSALINM